MFALFCKGNIPEYSKKVVVIYVFTSYVIIISKPENSCVFQGTIHNARKEKEKHKVRFL